MVSKLLNTGTIRARRVGKTWKVPASALEEFLAGRDNPAHEQDVHHVEEDEAEMDPEQARQELEAIGFKIKSRPGPDDGQPPA